MVYIETWEEFTKAAEQLYLSNPKKTRFTMKYRNCEGKLVVKMTDDVVVLKYRTEHAQDVKKVEKLNNILMRHMTAK
ncbi:signal recognition particle 9 kDa protein isoform X1 [Hydra vulgaris]|uniref:Signal recognition particle 9 kDa protein n=1 Tax=Hydra vulgaris TaxID=6087 RepID=A0ABM4BTN3_HYDVU|nr:signal recognition particle 9 kDa protein [Hydra vulgaris]